MGFSKSGFQLGLKDSLSSCLLIADVSYSNFDWGKTPRNILRLIQVASF